MNEAIEASEANEAGYLVEVKRSARRRNGWVGEAVNEDGATRDFEDRAAADEWASALSEAGEHRVWVQDAPPHANGPVDGYLVSRREPRSVEAPFESEQRELSAQDR